MSPYMIYQMVQAEQAEQRARYGSRPRQEDARLGELAAAVAQWSRRLARPAASVRGGLRRRLAREMP